MFEWIGGKIKSDWDNIKPLNYADLEQKMNQLTWSKAPWLNVDSEKKSYFLLKLESRVNIKGHVKPLTKKK